MSMEEKLEIMDSITDLVMDILSGNDMNPGQSRLYSCISDMLDSAYEKSQGIDCIDMHVYRQ